VIKPFDLHHHRRNIKEVRREQLVHQAREMYIESKENWIPRDCDRTQWNRNGEGKGGQSA